MQVWRYEFADGTHGTIRSPKPLTRARVAAIARSHEGKSAKAKVSLHEVTRPGAGPSRGPRFHGAAPARRRRQTRRSSRKPARRTSRHRARTTKTTAKRSTTSYEQDIIAKTHKLLAQWKVTGYDVEFTDRMTSAMGKVNHRRKMISFSRPLFDRGTPDQRRQIMIHEVAHAVVAFFHGRQPGVSHGKEWRSQMRKMGIANPSRTHSVSREGLKRKRRDTIAVTCCGKEFRITIKRLARGRTRCKCGGPLEFASDADRRAFEAATRPMTANMRVCGLGR